MRRSAHIAGEIAELATDAAVMGSFRARLLDVLDREIGFPEFQGHAAVPGLILMGEHDPNPAPGDAAHLAADYGSLGGGTATVEVVPGGTHIFRLDAAAQGAPFWSRVLAFVD